jgi:hypothetical protein
METIDQDNLAKLKKELLGEDKPTRSLNYRVGALSEKDRNTLVYIAKQALMMMRMKLMVRGYSDETYDTLVSNINRSVSPDLKRLVVEVLEEIQPVPVREQPKKQYNGSSIYDDPSLFPQPELKQRDKDTPVPFVRRPTQEPEQLSFIDKLEASESSGRSDAEITLDDGRKYVGLMQMGEARLEDYKKATNTSFTQEQFKNDKELQDKVSDWHLADIDKNIDAMGDDAKGYSRDGLRAVAHLGGVGGMRKYVKSKGQYNPSDQLGTSLSDYYNKFSGEA